MKVHVLYLSILRDVTGKKEEDIELSKGSSMKDLIAALLGIYGAKLKPFLSPNSEIGSGIILTLNGELLSNSELGKKIPDDAEVLVGLPPFGG